MQTGVRKRITIADIARESGYSKTAVSFAFNNPDRISDEACSRILETARKLNYIPDPRARNFSLGKQLTLGFLLPQDIDTCLANPYLVDVIRGLGRVCQENGYMLSIIPPLNDSLYEAVKNATVDGLVTMGYLGDGVSSLVDLIVMPLVMIDGGDDDAFLSINIDDEAAACLQLEKVLEAGHRRISIVSLPAPTLEPDANDSGIVACRMRGYRKALSAHGLDEGHVCFMQTHETTFDDGWRKAQEIISHGGIHGDGRPRPGGHLHSGLRRYNRLQVSTSSDDHKPTRIREGSACGQDDVRTSCRTQGIEGPAGAVLVHRGRDAGRTEGVIRWR